MFDIYHDVYIVVNIIIISIDGNLFSIIQSNRYKKFLDNDTHLFVSSKQSG